MPQGNVPSLLLDTGALPPDAAFALWAQAMEGYEVARDDPGGAFSAHAEAWMLGPVVLSRSRVGPVRLARSPVRILRDRLDHFSFALPLEGDWRTSFDGREVRSLPGVVTIFDNSRPYVAVGSRLDLIVALIPRSAIELALGPVDLHGRRLEHPAGRLLADHLALLVSHMPSLTESEAPHVAQGMLSLVVSCLRASVRPPPRARPATLARHAARLIDSDLGADLTPEVLRARLNLSRASLYRAFAPLGGVASFIRERRLVRIHAIVSAGGTQPVKLLAAEFGFASGTHLTRAFRARFGYSLSALRQRTNAQVAPATDGVTQEFRRWLGALS
jgi:AraC-like DNA-binding protein